MLKKSTRSKETQRKPKNVCRYTGVRYKFSKVKHNIWKFIFGYHSTKPDILSIERTRSRNLKAKIAFTKAKQMIKV